MTIEIWMHGNPRWICFCFFRKCPSCRYHIMTIGIHERHFTRGWGFALKLSPIDEQSWQFWGWGESYHSLKTLTSYACEHDSFVYPIWSSILISLCATLSALHSNSWYAISGDQWRMYPFFETLFIAIFTDILNQFNILTNTQRMVEPHQVIFCM